MVQAGLLASCNSSRVRSEKARLQSRCDFLVATPGRLIDHLENTGLAQQLSGIRTLVLDEADQLLEMGFRPAIEKILSEFFSASVFSRARSCGKCFRWHLPCVKDAWQRSASNLTIMSGALPIFKGLHISVR